MTHKRPGTKRSTPPAAGNQREPVGGTGRSRWLISGALAASAALGFRAAAEPAQPQQSKSTDLLASVLAERHPRLGSGVDPWVSALLLDDDPGAGAGEPVGASAGGGKAVLRQSDRFDIPPGPLRTVLAAFEAATAIRAEVEEAGILELGSPGVSGQLTVEKALEELLAGTGVRYRFTGDRTVRLALRAIEDAVVVTAHARPASPKYTEALLDTPQSIAVIPADVLEERAATTLRDALRNVTGISIQAGEGGVPAGDNLSIRGFNARTDLFIDGVRDLGGYTRDSFNVEQVEVAKGPGSAYLGRGSTGGAVNLVSKSPHLATVQGASLGIGSDDYSRATIDVNQPLDTVPGGALRVNAVWARAKTPGRDTVEDERWGIAPSLALGLGTPTRVTLGYFHLAQENVPDYGIPWVPADNVPLADFANQAPPVDFDNFYGLAGRDYEKTRTSVATAQIDHDFNDSLSFRNLTRWGETYRDSVITAPRFTTPESTEIRRSDWKSRDQTDGIVANQADLLATFETGSLRHRLVAGVELALETSENFTREETGAEPGGTDLFAPDPNDPPYLGSIERTGGKTDADGRSTAAYAFDTVEVSERWQVSGGLRWDRFDLDYDSEDEAFSRVDEMVSWRAGAVYKPVPQGSVYAAAGTSFNPSAEGLSLRSTTAEVEPEKSRSYEVGTKWDLFGGHASLNAALFETDKTNARTPGLDPGDPPTVLAGEQRVRGFEIGLSGRLTERWYSWLGYTALDSDVERSNNPAEAGGGLGNTPDHSLSLWTTYRLRAGLEIGAGAQYVGERYNNNRRARLAPSYWLLDAMLAYEVNQHLTLRLNAANLTDEDYIDRVGGGHFIPGRGRSVALTTTLSR